MKTIPGIDARFTFAHDKSSELEISVPGFSVRITAPESENEDWYGEIIISCDESREMNSRLLRTPAQGLILHIQPAAVVPGNVARPKLEASIGITIDDVEETLAYCQECENWSARVCQYCDRCANCAPGGLYLLDGEYTCRDPHCNGFDIGESVVAKVDIDMDMLAGHSGMNVFHPVIKRGAVGRVIRYNHSSSALRSGLTHYIAWSDSVLAFYANPDWLDNKALPPF